MAEPVFARLAIIGCGLIGSSLARGARASGAAGQIVIHDASAFARARIAELGLADEVVLSAEEAVAGADLVIFATPVRAFTEPTSLTMVPGAMARPQPPAPTPSRREPSSAMWAR